MFYVEFMYVKCNINKECVQYKQHIVTIHYFNNLI